MPTTIKLGWIVTYHKRLLPIKSLDALFTWTYEITWQTKPIILSPTQSLLPSPNLVEWWLTVVVRTYKAHDPLITWPEWCHVTTWKIYFFTFTRLMATKLGKVLTSRRRFSTQTLKSSPTSCLLDYWSRLFI